jgi:hypothetical protein
MFYVVANAKLTFTAGKYCCMKPLALLIFLVVAVACKSQHHGDMQADKPSTHGMVIFGRETIYASHLPLFHAPHHYQIILQLQLEKTTQQKFIKDQQLHPEAATYSIEPEKFILPEIIEKPRQFKANLYRGHFERGGVKIADSITVKITDVVYFKKLDPEQTKDSTVNFILFGNNKAQYAVHHISNKPDFEQIIQIKSYISLFTGKAKYSIAVFDEHNNSPVGVSGNEIEATTETKKFKLALLKQIYLEFDDLKE